MCVTEPCCCPRSGQCCCRTGCHDWHPRHWKVGPAFLFLPPTLLPPQRSSGAHVNPQVSVAFALTGDLAPLSLPAYLLGQFLGAGAAAALVLVLYLDALTPAALAAMASSPGVAESTFPLVGVASCPFYSPHIFWSFDSPHISQIVDQVVASCLLQLVNACVKEQVTRYMLYRVPP